jgi:hypothetical protein
MRRKGKQHRKRRRRNRDVIRKEMHRSLCFFHFLFLETQNCSVSFFPVSSLTLTTERERERERERDRHYEVGSIADILALFSLFLLSLFTHPRRPLFLSKDTYHWQVDDEKDWLFLRFSFSDWLFDWLVSQFFFEYKEMQAQLLDRKESQRETNKNWGKKIQEGKSMTVWSLSCQSLVESDRKITLKRKCKMVVPFESKNILVGFEESVSFDNWK